MSVQTPTIAPRRHGVAANVIRGCLGNTIEWFDWFVYATFSLYFAASFFPGESPTAQLLASSAVFAVGFLMRPLGGWLLGAYADWKGRRAALTLSVLLMSGGSLAIALIPSYASIGLAAPILLLVVRLVQGLSVGGEFGSSATYLSEIATPKRRGFFSSFQYVSIVLGQLLALIVMIVMQQIFSDSTITAWAWRIPFVIGAILGLVVLYLRRTMDETDHFKADQAQKEAHKAATFREGEQIEKRGLKSLLTEYPKQMAAVFALAIGGTVAFYTFTTYFTKYMVNSAGLPKSMASVISFIALLIFMVLQPLTGMLSDRFGRKPVMLFFALGIMISTVPIFTIVGHTHSGLVAFAGMMIGLVFLSGYTALAAIVKAELFPTKIRAIGVGVPHALVAAVFGGTTETVALSLKNAGHESAFFYWVIGCVALTLVAILLIPETSRNSTLEAQDPTVSPADGGITDQHSTVATITKHDGTEEKETVHV
ncbi:MHS family alpha-ketoglutarate permease-like MFS transporter [Branchiibius hedensis]|uniref:Putative proline/betaine transporter n=1 Tax=Branchiibius hedensis TaxID=672460 RepID=A0A2Y8ZZJ8_9MICO|nr:MFS transporter [Branchiibius hedensis]PWJ26525.1 MHS family alpha-ketoglutarate permease-like MFS transporter [Branchiibius hedensis]SSA35337.1 MFS transporter, MHS family, alpha-ketoglutarate permease [Branchiibius hedensis]